MLLPALAGIAIIPMPAKIALAEGRLELGDTVQVDVDRRVSSVDQRRLKWALSTFLHVRAGRSGPRFHFSLSEGDQGAEAYSLAIGERGVQVTAAGVAGLYWSIQTLRQLVASRALPYAMIEDAPAFGWRGVLLDEGRHFMGAAFVKRFLDVMSLYKFNVLHWHLTEDQGWRIQVDSHPNLTRVGSRRVEADGSVHAGFYTKAQIREIVRYAADRNIQIVPEIEMPGHCSAAIASYPELGCARPTLAVPPTWGVFQDVYCAGRESTFKFLEDVIGEVAELFPSPYFHIGGDEVPKDRWKVCPDCQRRMRAEGLSDEHALQSWFIRRVQRTLAVHGKSLIGWDEIMEGGLAPGAVVQVWTDIAQAGKAIQAGNRVILSPSSHLYLNVEADRYPLDHVYGFKIPKGLDPSKVLGLETTLWSERITAANCLPKFLPRALAVAEIFWRNPQKDLAEFRRRLALNLTFARAAGLPVGPEDRAIATYDLRATRDGLTISPIAGIDGMAFRTDPNRTPTPRSPVVTGSVTIPLGEKVTLAPFLDRERIDIPRTFETVAHLAVGAAVTLSEQPAPQYGKAGASGVVDGVLGSSDFHDGLWLGWQGKDVAITIDLGASRQVADVAVHCLQEMRSWILMPKSLEFEVSNDGVGWTRTETIDNDLPDTHEATTARWFRGRSKVRTARFVRVRAHAYGKLPPWHNGAGGDAWTFIDEVAVR